MLARVAVGMLPARMIPIWQIVAACCTPLRIAVVCVLLSLTNAWAQVPFDQDADLIDRPVSAIRLEGLQRVSEQIVRNNIRTAVGEPFDAVMVRADISSWCAVLATSAQTWRM